VPALGVRHRPCEPAPEARDASIEQLLPGLHRRRLGACLRHACNLIGARVAVGSPWPWSTFLINISGALLMGVVVEAFALRNGASPQLRLLLATGILGGYTTFSTYALEIGLLLQRGQHGLAALYAGGSVALGLAGLFGGMKLARLVLG
jgi:CrcB protein